MDLHWITFQPNLLSDDVIQQKKQGMEFHETPRSNLNRKQIILVADMILCVGFLDNAFFVRNQLELRFVC